MSFVLLLIFVLGVYFRCSRRPCYDFTLFSSSWCYHRRHRKSSMCLYPWFCMGVYVCAHLNLYLHFNDRVLVGKVFVFCLLFLSLCVSVFLSVCAQWGWDDRRKLTIAQATHKRFVCALVICVPFAAGKLLLFSILRFLFSVSQKKKLPKMINIHALCPFFGFDSPVPNQFHRHKHTKQVSKLKRATTNKWAQMDEEEEETLTHIPIWFFLRCFLCFSICVWILYKLLVIWVFLPLSLVVR